MKNLITVYFILALLVLSGCAKLEDPRTIKGIAPEFSNYVNLYISLKGSSIKDIPIQLADLEYPMVGKCTRWASGYRQIEISRSYWLDEHTTESERINVLFHELGHCDLNRDHDSSFRKDGYPTSLMFPYNIGFLDNMASYYYNELFGRVTQSSRTKTDLHEPCVEDIDDSH